MGKKPVNTIKEYHLHHQQPKKLQFTIHDLNVYLEEHKANATRPHIHSFYQIIWFKSGSGQHFVDFREYDVFENAIFFIAKNQVHYFDNKSNYEGVLIHFNESFIASPNNEMDFFLKCSLFNNPYQQPSCCIGTGIHQILNEYLQQIKTELPNVEAFGQTEMLKAYLKNFLIQVQRQKNEFEKVQGKVPFMVDEKRLQLVQFSNLVEENYTKGWAVADFARLLHISARTLSDLTNHILNKTPSQMIHERIILEAQRLLLHSHLNVNQIAYRLGFEDPSYFVKYFRKYTATSPTAFRKAIS